MEQQPLVSVVVTVYNHERYIEQCLRSIAAQKTSFPFEVLVGEDCSPDGSRAVCERLRDELPGNFIFFLRETNYGGSRNSTDLVNRCRGKYLAACEGDDFWTYEGKLQEQVDFLEAHPEYGSVYHHSLVVGEDGQPNGEVYPDCRDEDYSWREYFYCTMPGQTGTMLVRREPYVQAKAAFNALRRYERYQDDRRNAFVCLSMGKVRCIQQQWSAYRHVTSGGASWSSTVRIDESYARNEVLFAQTLVDFARTLDNPEALQCARLTYYRLLLKWSVGKVAPYGLGSSLREVMSERDWPRLLAAPLRWYAVLGTRAVRGRSVTL